MTDGLSRTYADLLEGQYDCLDRIVLNAYFRFACRPPGFRVWWRQLYGLEAALDNTQLRNMAGRFRRRLRTWAITNQIPLVRCKPGQVQHEIAVAYRKTTPVLEGLFLVLEGRGPAPVWEVLGKGYLRRKQPSPFVYYYSFHILDPDWGHLVIRMSGHAPFSAQIMLNGHEYVERQAQKAGISFTKESNCFTQIGNSHRFANLTETGTDPGIVERLTAVCDRWIYSTCLCFALSEEEQARSRFRYQYSFYQFEYSRNFLFERGAEMQQVAEALIDRNRTRLDVKRLTTILGRRNRPAYRTRKPREWQIAVERAAYDMTIFKIYCGKIALKLYTKSERVLRAEAMALDARDLRCGRDLGQFAKAAQKLQAILERFLEVLSCLDRCWVSAETMEQLPKPAQVGQVRVGGLDFNEGRTAAVAKSLQALSVQPRGFTASELARQVQRHSPARKKYTPRQAAYDLLKFRAKKLVLCLPGTRRYAVPLSALRKISAILLLRDHVLPPLLTRAGQESVPEAYSEVTPLEHLYQQLRGTMRQVFVQLGVAA